MVAPSVAQEAVTVSDSVKVVPLAGSNLGAETWVAETSYVTRTFCMRQCPLELGLVNTTLPWAEPVHVSLA